MTESGVWDPLSAADRILILVPPTFAPAFPPVTLASRSDPGPGTVDLDDDPIFLRRLLCLCPPVFRLIAAVRTRDLDAHVGLQVLRLVKKSNQEVCAEIENVPSPGHWSSRYCLCRQEDRWCARRARKENTITGSSDLLTASKLQLAVLCINRIVCENHCT